MQRYLVLSLFLHALIFMSFLNRRSLVIEDPIVSVTLDSSDQKQKQNAPKSAVITSLHKPKIPSLETANDPSKSQNSENTNETSSPSSAYESGNVSVKPKVMKQIQVTYPQQAKEARIEGAVRLSVLINELGQVGEVTVLDGPGFGLNEAATEALKQFLFSPAEVEGHKVPVRIVYVYRFKLESR